MAGKYHINGDSVSPCRAEKGNCPFDESSKGGEENHYDDAGEAMKVLEDRLADEYNGSNAPSVSKAKPKTAKELAEEGVDPKQIRDALRQENPTWKPAQVHLVQQRMTAAAETKASSNSSNVSSASSSPASSSPKPRRKLKSATSSSEPTRQITGAQLKNEFSFIDKARKERARVDREIAAQQQHNKEYDSKYGAIEGRAHYYTTGGGRASGVNPSGPTYFDRHPGNQQKLTDLYEQRKQTFKDEELAQTTIEESGNGHLIPDEGNTIRVRTQEQKWLLENELKGQISDGMWENSSNNPWQDWTSAKVVVDPDNPGRNFSTTRDSYNLNAKALLEAVGDRMVDEVKEKTGRDYDAQTMYNDLSDLKKIFKTQRGVHTPDPVE